jgi:hypothetical protein
MPAMVPIFFIYFIYFLSCSLVIVKLVHGEVVRTTRRQPGVEFWDFLWISKYFLVGVCKFIYNMLLDSLVVGKISS